MFTIIILMSGTTFVINLIEIWIGQNYNNNVLLLYTQFMIIIIEIPIISDSVIFDQ